MPQLTGRIRNDRYLWLLLQCGCPTYSNSLMGIQCKYIPTVIEKNTFLYHYPEQIPTTPISLRQDEEVRRRQLRQKKKVSPADGRQSWKFLKHFLNLPWQCQVRSQCKILSKSCWWAAGSWHGAGLGFAREEGADVAQSRSTQPVRVKGMC